MAETWRRPRNREVRRVLVFFGILRVVGGEVIRPGPMVMEHMTEFDAKILAIANKAVYEAQEENRRLGIANVYSLNGTLVWQLPDGSITDKNPMAGMTP